MPLGIDLDDVLVDTLTQINAWYNQTYGTSFRKEDYLSWNFAEVWHRTDEEIQAQFDLFRQTDFFKGILPSPEAQESVRLLSEQDDLVVITGRSDQYRTETEASVEKYFPGRFSSINFSRHGGIFIPKSEICQELGVHTIIDDCPKFVKNCAQAGIRVLLFDFFWNQDFSAEGVERVYGWFGSKEKPGVMEKFNLSR